MVDFDKKAVYLSYMENGIKVGSAGCLKLEVRDGRCRLDMRVGLDRLPGQNPEGSLPVFLVTEAEEDMTLHAASRGAGEDEGKAEGQIKIGNISMEKGRGIWTGEYEAERMGGVDLPYSSVHGLVIPIGDGKCVVGSWGAGERRDSPDEGCRVEQKGGIRGNIRPADAAGETGKQRGGRAAVNRNGKALWMMRTAAEKTGKKGSPDGERKEPRAVHGEGEAPQAVRTAEMNEETGGEAGEKKASQAMQPVEMSGKTGKGQGSRKPHADRDNPDGFKMDAGVRSGAEESSQTEGERKIRAVLKKKPVYAGEGGESAGAAGWSGWADPEDKAGRCASKLLSDKWQQLLKLYPNIHPYDDERVYISLEPKDFIILTKEYQHLCNNSFLLHGFYNYRHVILGIEEKRFYLGVPGVYYEREKLVAIMFGFEAFEAPGGIVEEGRFGYYLRRVKI